MQDIAHHQDFDTAEAPHLLTYGKGIQQGLGWVLVGPIAGIDNAGIDPVCQVATGTGMGMAHHQHIDFHGENIADRIAQGFTFGYGAPVARKIYDIGRKAFLGQFKGKSGPGGVLKKKVGDGQIPQRGNFAYRAIKDLQKLIGGL